MRNCRYKSVQGCSSSEQEIGNQVFAERKPCPKEVEGICGMPFPSDCSDVAANAGNDDEESETDRRRMKSRTVSIPVIIAIQHECKKLYVECGAR